MKLTWKIIWIWCEGKFGKKNKKFHTTFFKFFSWECYSLRTCRSICMQLCITLTRWPHLSVNLKSTFIQMCSARWRLTLHNPSKCSIWREGLELFESSESSLACGGAADIREEAVESFHPGSGGKKKKVEKSTDVYGTKSPRRKSFVSVWPALSLHECISSNNTVDDV